MKKKFLQKWIALLLAVLTVLSLVTACGSVDQETVEAGLEVLDAVLTEMQEIEAEMEAEEAAGEDSIPDELPPDEALPEEVTTEPEEPVPEEPVGDSFTESAPENSDNVYYPEENTDTTTDETGGFVG